MHLVGLIGANIDASLSPALHEAEAAALGIPYEYRIFDLIELGLPPEAVGGLIDDARASGFAALNITHPCKQIAVGLVDELDRDAGRLGAVNLVVFDGERTIGHNTDWMGFRDALEAGLPDASLRRVVQLGCGGAGAATAYALLASGASHLALSDVDLARADALTARMRELFPDQEVTTVAGGDLDGAIPRAAGVVHATPMGMVHHPGVAFDVALLSSDAWVSDVVYRPLETELIQRARAAGHRVLDGGRMAVGQAHASLQIITGRVPDRARMEEHFRTLIRGERAPAA